MSLFLPYARDSQSHYDYLDIYLLTFMSGGIAFFATGYGLLIAFGANYPLRHFSNLGYLLFHKVFHSITNFGSDQANIYQSFLISHKFEMSIIYGLASIVAAIVGYHVFNLVHKPINGENHVRGRRLVEKSAAEADARASQKVAHQSGGGKGLKIHPSITLSRAQEVQSFLFMACQGGGKTQVLWRMMDAAINRVDENNNFSGDKNIIYDLVKGDFTESVGKSPNGASPILISPWDERSAVWDIAKDCRTLADAASFSRGLIPSSQDPLWSNASRNVLTAILVKLQSEYSTNWGWYELYQLAYLPVEDLKEIAAKHYPPALAAVMDAESKTTQSIYINLHAFLSPIYRLFLLYKDSKNKRFSIIEWLNNDNSHVRNIILQGNLEDEELSAGYIRSITEILTNRIASLEFEQSKKRRIWFWLDEVKQAGKIECLARLMEYGRSKGVACVLAIQDISQIRQLYPQHEDQKWLALCGIKIYGQIRGGDSQKFVVDQIGTRIVDRYQQSINKSTANENERSVNTSYARDNNDIVVLESELEELGLTNDNGGGIKAMVIGIGPNALKLQWSFYSPPKLRKPFVSRENADNNILTGTNSLPAKYILAQENTNESNVNMDDVMAFSQDYSDFCPAQNSTDDNDLINQFLGEAQHNIIDDATDSNLGVLIEDADLISELVGSESSIESNQLGTVTVGKRKKRYLSKTMRSELQNN